jgi:hypothetical protein
MGRAGTGPLHPRGGSRQTSSISKWLPRSRLGTEAPVPVALVGRKFCRWGERGQARSIHAAAQGRLRRSASGFRGAALGRRRQSPSRWPGGGRTLIGLLESLACIGACSWQKGEEKAFSAKRIVHAAAGTPRDERYRSRISTPKRSLTVASQLAVMATRATIFQCDLITKRTRPEIQFGITP